MSIREQYYLIKALFKVFKMPILWDFLKNVNLFKLILRILIVLFFQEKAEIVSFGCYLNILPYRV